MWINIGTKKEENKVWVQWFSNPDTKIRPYLLDRDGKPLTIDKEISDFLYQQLENKAKADLKKSPNPSEDAKTWKPTFGRKVKSKVEKLAEQIGKLSNEDQKVLKELL